MIVQSIKMALEAIASNKVRSFLTMLGIIIGVIALVVLVSLVSSATTSITDQVSSLGSNMLTVSVMDDKGNPLRLSELSDFTANDKIAAVAPLAQTMVTAKNGYTDESATLYGTTPAYGEIQGLEVEYGRFLRTTDVDNSTYVAVLSQDAATELYGKPDVVGETISLNGRSFLIVGVLPEDTSMMSMMLFFILAEIGYRGAQVFYDSLLTDVSTPESVGSVSGKGWAIGMIGGIVALLAALIPIQLAGNVFQTK